MAKQSLTKADQVYYGGGYDPIVYGSNGRLGVPVCFLTRVSLGAPAASDDDLLIDDATSTELPNNGTKTYTPATNGTSPTDNASIPAAATIVTSTGASATVWTLDAARNLIFGTSSAVGDTVFTVTGYDVYKVKMAEQVTIAAAGSSAAGKKAFKYIESIAIYSASNITTDTVTVGTGEVLGLPYTLTGTGDFFQASLDGVFEATRPTAVKADATTATATTGDPRGTIDLNSSLAGTEVIAYFHVTNPGSDTGLRGVAHYGG